MTRKALTTTTVLARWRPGSGDWDWPAEWADVVVHHGMEIADLIRDVAVNGITNPVLLGDDGRVWDGHKRLMAARLLGLGAIPVEHGHGGLHG